MKKYFFLIGITAFLLGSCSKNRNYEQMAVGEISMDANVVSNTTFAEKYKEAPSPETYISSSAAVENPNDTVRKIIRTADVKFKVKDVIKATYKIENIVVANGGYVEHTNLGSNINDMLNAPKNQDSTVVTTFYTINNTLTLRVPSVKLDTTLKEIAQLVDFMDYRIINARNVALDLLAKRLERNRIALYNARMNRAIDQKGRKLNDISDAENNLLYKAQQADQAQLASLLLADSIKYSTVSLFIYQNRSVKKETIESDEIYKTPFGTRFVNNLKFGWTIITEIFLFVVNLWAIILIAAVVYFAVKYIRKKYFRKNK
ncbi:MAG: DUF4349 domain-containing protein [Paludibacter sp.]|nr:DUF4349 domain-containing protein [Paludibacter sp.]